MGGGGVCNCANVDHYNGGATATFVCKNLWSTKCICANGKKYLCKLFKTSLSQVQSLLCEASKAWNLVRRKTKSYASFKVLKIEATFREAIFLKYCIDFYEDNKGSHP